MKRLFAVPILFAVAWFAFQPTPPATSQPLPIAKHIAKSIPVQTDGVTLKIEGGKDVEKVVMVPKVVTVKVIDTFPFAISAPAGAGLYFWSYPVTVTAQDQGDRLQVTAAPKGEVSIGVKLITAKLDKDRRFLGFETKFGSVTVNVGDVPPGPTPPDPKPPEPPGPVTGLRVVFVMEKGQATLTPAQTNVIYSKQVADYLDAKCAGGKAGWRRWDKDTSVAAESDVWKKLWAAVKPQLGTLPQIVIVSDQSGEVLPLPATVEECLTLLRKYGG